MWADTHRAREVLGFAPKVSLREGLAQEVAWLRSQSDGAFSDTASRLVPL
jgi:nucleoside-diphosphate-sugar epimerase